jgi:hypothetical protein
MYSVCAARANIIDKITAKTCQLIILFSIHVVNCAHSGNYDMNEKCLV